MSEDVSLLAALKFEKNKVYVMLCYVDRVTFHISYNFKV